MLALAWGVAAQAAPAGEAAPRGLPLEGITNPDWVKLPNGDDFAQYYPQIARALGIGGRVVMQCEVTATGRLDHCRADQETPPGMGFGAAAIAMSKLFVMKPMTVGGEAVGGAEVRVPIRFAPPPPAVLSPEAQEPAPAPSPKAVELARRIVAASVGEQEKAAMLGAISKTISGQFASGNLSEQEQAAMDAITASASNAFPLLLDAVSEDYATRFTDAELVDIDAFFQSPSGRAWVAKANGPLLTQRTAERFELAVLAGARKRFCAKYDCAVADPAGPKK
ncbi:MAG: TonB family protein [Caulobacteraceae bacterium]